MKKSLLLLGMAALCLSANAQEGAQVNIDAIGATAEKTYVTVAGGTEFASTTNVTLTSAFEDNYQYLGVTGPKVDEKDYKTITVGTTTLEGNGLQGKTNPIGADGANSANVSEPPTAGAVFKFDVKKDGYLYVFHKASSNKQYQVSEGDENGYQVIGYVFSQATDATKKLPKTFGYTLKSGQLEGEDADYNHLPAGYKISWPEVYYTGDAASANKQNGLSVIKFPVVADMSYLVNACGSKMTLLGYYFDETGDATVTISNGVSDDITLLNAGVPADNKVIDVLADYQKQVAGINTISAKTAKSAQLFNLAGQRVSKAYKGVVVANGKKFIQK